jgi:predicted phage terminase large subunit-like protein
MDKKNDKYRYKGSAFHRIYYDELTQFPESDYLYLFTRNRKLSGSIIPTGVRSASNPGEIGHGWVKKRFITGGNSNDRIFIPAKIEDNPSLDKDDYFSRLDQVDPVTRAQIRDGDWTDFDGGRFKKEWLCYYQRRCDYYVFNGELLTSDKIVRRFQTLDFAWTPEHLAKKDPDYTVSSTWGVTKHGFLVWLGCSKARISLYEIPDFVWSQYTRWNCNISYGEANAVQKVIVDLIRRVKPNINLVEVRSSEDKLTRSVMAQNLAASRRIYLPENDPTFPLTEVVEELASFTGVGDSHDDVVDTLSCAAKVAEFPVTGDIPYIL